MKIQGVQHEITTIPGVVEDVTDIILNISRKRLVVKNLSDHQTKDSSASNAARRVWCTAANVITDEQVQIINPEQHPGDDDRRRPPSSSR